MPVRNESCDITECWCQVLVTLSMWGQVSQSYLCCLADCNHYLEWETCSEYSSSVEQSRFNSNIYQILITKSCWSCAVDRGLECCARCCCHTEEDWNVVIRVVSSSWTRSDTAWWRLRGWLWQLPSWGPAKNVWENIWTYKPRQRLRDHSLNADDAGDTATVIEESVDISDFEFNLFERNNADLTLQLDNIVTWASFSFTKQSRSRLWFNETMEFYSNSSSRSDVIWWCHSSHWNKFFSILTTCDQWSTLSVLLPTLISNYANYERSMMIDK